MIDVHPPHSKIEGIRDFLLHLFTITVGLLIALGLEGCVERHHQHVLRDEATQTLRHEIADNAKELVIIQKAVQEEEGEMMAVVQFIDAYQKHQTADPSGLKLSYTIGRFEDAGWRTAAATGALSYMDYGQVNTYSGVYSLQSKVQSLQDSTFADFQNLRAYAIPKFDPSAITPAQAVDAGRQAKLALVHLAVLQSLTESLAQLYDKSAN